MAITRLDPAGMARTRSGAQLALGLVYTYEVGTTTDKATYPTYDDALAGTNANANPVVLDSQGLADIWLDGLYRLVVKTSGGTTVDDVDDYGDDSDANTLALSAISGLAVNINSSDPTNDIDIAAGIARDGADSVDMPLTVAITKRADATWVVGTGNGGMQSALTFSADTIYYVWLIERSDTEVVDVMFSTSRTAPSLPSNYDKKRLIGVGKTASGSAAWAWVSSINRPWQGLAGVVPDTGSANAIAIAPDPAITAYAMGQTWNALFLTDSTSRTVTCAVNGLTAKSVKKYVDDAIVDCEISDIQAGNIGRLYYDGTYVILLNPPIRLRRGKNLLINGDAKVYQRGTVTGLGASTAYGGDMWPVLSVGSPQGRVSAIQTTGFNGGAFAHRLDCTTAEGAVAVGEVIALYQPMEAQDLQFLRWGNAAASPLMLSFSLKSPKSGAHCVALFSPDGTRSCVQEFTVTAANTAENFTVLFPGDTGGTINSDTGEGMRVVFPLVCGSTFQTTAGSWAAGTYYATSNQQNLLDNTANNFDVTNIKLEAGSIATPFDALWYADTLRQCQRYYWRINSSGDADPFGGVGSCRTTSEGVFRFQFPVAMRAAPVLATTGTAADYQARYANTSTDCTSVPSAFTPATVSAHAIASANSTNPLTAGGAVLLQGKTGTTAYLAWSAEL